MLQTFFQRRTLNRAIRNSATLPLRYCKPSHKFERQLATSISTLLKYPRFHDHAPNTYAVRGFSSNLFEGKGTEDSEMKEIKDVLFYLQVNPLSKSPDERLEQRKLVKKTLENIVPKLQDPLENLQEMILLLRKLIDQGFFIDFHGFIQVKFISKVLEAIQSQPERLDDQMKIEILGLCGQLRYRYPSISSSDQLILKDVIMGISIASVAQSFSSFSNYFFALAIVEILWKDLAVNYRRRLLSSMKQLGNGDEFPLPKAVRLIVAIEELLVTKNYQNEVDEDVKRYYEQLLNRVLRERYEGNNSRDQIAFEEGFETEEERQRILKTGVRDPLSMIDQLLIYDSNRFLPLC